VPKPNLLGTKFHPPPMPARWVQRPHLIRRLNEGLKAGRPVTLVSAPAGFGKTTFVGEWVQTLERWPVSWLALDPADNDPGRFLAYFIAALQKVDPALGREIEGVLRAGQLPPSQAIGTFLVNDLLTLESRCLLVLDDFHLIQDQFVLNLMEQLLAAPPPALHLALITREDPPLPLARLRAHNRLNEIRARDLRFNSRDTDRFLKDVMGLRLSRADVAALEDKTEGWIAGLQMAGLSVRDTADPSGFIAALSGSHRYILSYLTEEVLDRQPAEIRRFLLQTSILDRLNGGLCNTVTGRSDSHALLERLFKANLFLVPLDDEGHWYRYHHLFADLLCDLQNTLQKDETVQLHRRASHWFAQASTGEQQTFASQAIQHALAAQDYAMAVDLLESHAMGMIMQGYAKTVDGWMEAIPEAWRSQSPKTNLALAWVDLLRGAYAQASPYLERLQVMLGDSRGEEKASLRAEWMVMWSLMYYMQGNTAESMDMATRALEIAPERDSRVRGLAYYALASLYRMMEDYPHAVEAFQSSIHHARAANNLVAEMMSTSGLALMAFEHGQLHLAFEIAKPVSARIEGSGSPPPISTVVFGILGEVCYQWYQTEQARHNILHTLKLSKLGGYNSGIVACQVLLSRLSQLEGDLESAAREIQQAIDLMPAEPPDYIRQEAVSQQVRVYLAQNLPDAAELALQEQGFSTQSQFSYPELTPDRSLSHSLGLLYNSALCALLHRARAGRDPAGLQPGIELAGRLVDRALQSQTLIVALEALLLRAQMQAVVGDHSASQADYVRALELAEPEGFLGVFIEQGPPVAEALAELAGQKRLDGLRSGYVKDILSAFSGPVSPGERPAAGTEPAEPIEPLTDRELEVLRLMAEGLKYKEMAARLFISLNTVRFHVKAIYGKLGVNNRTQAIRAARQLQNL
jgi:LuxR family maltose regulon positive regulatory protein